MALTLEGVVVAINAKEFTKDGETVRYREVYVSDDVTVTQVTAGTQVDVRLGMHVCLPCEFKQGRLKVLWGTQETDDAN